ncbi:MAG: Rrf2 family transcriptional regulator [Kiritimatiellia bacterium]|jgi:Rrf2 family protein|nr:Rrf2 family transcriptional regulator [Kiritimatiellia bacterium]
MIHLPKPVEYALMALGEMQAGKPGQLFSVRTLADRLGIPYDRTGKVLQAMGRAGILRSVQGKYGGYQIARDLDDVSLATLMTVVVGPRAIAECLQPGQICPHRDRCTIRRGIVRIAAKTRVFLESIPIREMIDPC